MCSRACELSGSAIHAQRTLSRNTPYRDAIRGEFRRQTSRGYNEDLIMLGTAYDTTSFESAGRCDTKAFIFRLIERDDGVLSGRVNAAMRIQTRLHLSEQILEEICMPWTVLKTKVESRQRLA